MSKSTFSIEINRPPETVFSYLDDAQYVKQWISGLVELTPLTEGGSRVGAKTRQVFHENGRTIEMLEETLVYEPNRRVKIKGVTDGFWLTADYVLHRTPRGTRLDYEAELHMQGLLMKLLSPIIHRSSSKRINNDLTRLKALVESH